MGHIAGDGLILKDGIYNEKINITVSGTTEKPIVIKAKNIGTVRIIPSSNGSGLSIYSTTSQQIHDIVIEGPLIQRKGESAAITVRRAVLRWDY